MAQRHMHEFGTTREQLAQIALNGRANAALNPNAIYRDPMTLEDYLDVRMVSTPLCLYDCDVPADGSTAVIVSRADSAARPAQAAGAHRGHGLGAARPPVVGPVRRPHDHGAARRLDDDVGPHRAHPRRRRHAPRSTTASASSRSAGSRPSGSAAHGEGGPWLAEGRPTARHDVAAAQHPWRPAVGRAPARLRLPARGLRAALGRGRRAPGRHAPRWPSPPPVAGLSPPASCSAGTEPRDLRGGAGREVEVEGGRRRPGTTFCTPISLRPMTMWSCWAWRMPSPQLGSMAKSSCAPRRAPPRRARGSRPVSPRREPAWWPSNRAAPSTSQRRRRGGSR